MAPDALTISILESVLRQEMGLNITTLGKNSIKKALSRRMKALPVDNFFSYLSLIKKSNKELNSFIDEVAINETWFYRDEAPFATLSNCCLAWLKKNPENPLRLLSVPCSTGEEPYSMAIALIEAGIDSHMYNIDAIDISARSLATARKGIYRTNSFRGYSTRFQKRFFKEGKQNTYIIRKHVQKNVNFIKGNLLNLNIPLTPQSYNVIFCRNLLIYLDSSFHKTVIDTLSTLLRDDGLLFIGHSESGLFTDSPFKPAPYPKTFSYIKKKNRSLKNRADDNSVTKDAQKNESSLPNLQDILSHSAHNDNVENAEAITSAEKAIGQGEFSKAIAIYEKIIQDTGPSANIFYEIGSCFYELKEIPNSIKMLKKAIYLEPNYLEAINLLCQLYDELGDKTNYASFMRRRKRVQKRLSEKNS